MRDLNLYANYCMELLDNLGIEYGNVVKWEINTRAKKRWGQTSTIPGGYFAISISSTLLDERNSEKGLETTILHELLHTCPGCMNHGENWKRLADKVNRAYGYEISRASTAAAQGVVVGIGTRTEEIVYKYQFRCKRCGKIIGRQRNSDFVKNYQLYTHSNCGGGQLERIL